MSNQILGDHGTPLNFYNYFLIKRILDKCSRPNRFHLDFCMLCDIVTLHISVELSAKVKERNVKCYLTRSCWEEKEIHVFPVRVTESKSMNWNLNTAPLFQFSHRYLLHYAHTLV